MNVTIACVWVRGNVPYSVEYVAKLASMVRRWYNRPHRFVCLTDQPTELLRLQVHPIRIPSPAPLAGWWSKMRCFDPLNGLAGRVLYLDLDTLIMAPLDPIIDFPAPFALVPHSGTFNGKRGLAVVKRFNSSVMVWDAGPTGRRWSSLWLDWSPKVATRLWGDQDFIGEQLPPSVPSMPAEWFPRLSELKDGGPSSDAKVVLAKKPKNHVAAQELAWVAEAWR